MKTQEVLSADVLDIIFNNRNKLYGAYELRKNYHKRLRKSIVVTTTCMLVAVGIPIMANFLKKPNTSIAPVQPTMISCTIKTPELPKPIKSNTAKVPAPPPIIAVKHTLPTIVAANLATDDDLMPTKDDLKDAIAANQTHIGEPISDASSSVSDDSEITDNAPNENTLPNDDEIFEAETIEQWPEFPGGMDALLSYLSSHIKYPTNAFEQGIAGRVILGFVVNKSGDIDEIKVLKSVGYGCDEEAIRVVKNMPTWKPGLVNGRKVNVYYNLPITFEIQ